MASPATYPKSMMYFHLFGFLFVLMAYVSISLTELFPRGSISAIMVLQTHFFIGFLVLLLVIPRFLVRAKNLKIIPPIVPALTPTNQLLAHAGHLALYVWMVAMSLLGWALVSAERGSVDIFGIHIPGILAQNKDTAEIIGELHGACAGIGMFLIIGHGVMALWHHYRMQDTTLIRMFPWWKWGKEGKINSDSLRVN